MIERDDKYTFQDYAIERLKRSGVIIDPIFTHFIYDDKYNVRNHSVDLRDLDCTKYFLCYGCKRYFWIIEISQIIDWTQRNNKNIPIKKPNKGPYYELPEDLHADSYTIIPEGYYTDHESSIWLRNNPDIYSRLIEIVG